MFQKVKKGKHTRSNMVKKAIDWGPLGTPAMSLRAQSLARYRNASSKRLLHNLQVLAPTYLFINCILSSTLSFILLQVSYTMQCFSYLNLLTPKSYKS